MSELHPDCDGSVFCRVPGHVYTTPLRDGTRYSHIPLTIRQRKELDERRHPTTEGDPR